MSARPATPPGPAAPAAEPGPVWSLHTVPEAGSTNELASALPPGSAVRADRQSAGRGRYQRTWISDPGGLWLSAVVAVGPPEQGWSALPLAAGAAVCEALAALGARPLRLRWPNDVLCGPRKLAGLLVDQFQPGRAVVGIGVNVTNHPEAADPALAGTVVRLADLVTPTPDLDSLARRILAALAEVTGVLARDGFAALVPRVNRWWDPALGLEIETDQGRVAGSFVGIDGTGRLRVQTADGRVQELAAHQVVRLREVTD